MRRGKTSRITCRITVSIVDRLLVQHETSEKTMQALFFWGGEALNNRHFVTPVS
jgi:hypothetical protein